MIAAEHTAHLNTVQEKNVFSKAEENEFENWADKFEYRVSNKF